jgi:type III pantothenate kinase
VLQNLFMNIVIDIGNTRTKAGVFKDGQLLNIYSGSTEEVLASLSAYYAPNVIVSAVGGGIEGVLETFAKKAFVLVFDHKVNIPLTLEYSTPNTLGLDRLAAALGAAVTKPGKTMLVVDMGSCITIDLLKEGKVFSGGVISPGYNMRFKAMHTFTDKLPLFSSTALREEHVNLPGGSTKECMVAGVQQGIVFEIEGHIAYYRAIYPDIEVIMTGGDAPHFENKFNTPIFTKDSLVLVGLNRVLEYHVA